MHPHSAAFDLGLARYSLALEVVCYTVIAFMPTALTFTVFAMLASWGGGFNPAVQALALELYTRRHKSSFRWASDVERGVRWWLCDVERGVRGGCATSGED